jgi:UPF0042 nucleotide-binding protein
MRFRDPEHKREGLQYHDGRHPGIQRSIVRHADWPRLRADVMRVVDAPGNRGRDLTLHVFCRQGRHRSVAAGILLARELRARGRELTVELIHLDLPGRPCAVSGCRNCR